MISVYVLPIFIFLLLLYCLIKNIPAYSHFAKGARESVDVCFNIFPNLLAIFLCVQLFEESGLATILANFLSPAFQIIGIPKELTKLILMRPFTGSGSIALLTEIYNGYGVDSLISRCASVIVASSDTIFYITAIYFSTVKVKKLRGAIPISLFCTFVGTILACLLCRIM